MEENKDMLNNSEVVSEAAENTDVAEETVQNEKEHKKKEKNKKPKKLKNQAAFKRGGISLAVTAIVLVALIVLNVLVSALSKRFNLDFDMSADKVNTISDENVKFIKGVKDDITLTVCATEDNYLSYISYYSQNYYKAEANTDYFEQTLTQIGRAHV